MLSLYDYASIQAALAGPLDSKLRTLLARHASLLTTPYDLTELTHILVIQPGDSEEAIVGEIGLSPLANPIDGARYGGAGFCPYWDLLVNHNGWFELIITIGDSGFAYILFIQDAAGVDPLLLQLCRSFALRPEENRP